ncbi:hypothetical protein FXB38_39040 [Bradyrhizobium cytisi]|uniref:Uncharacterized protein n=1 Tax=Bradyrhizobium cytisi TaxID=515489 RepID=A0A5S4VVZ8_9BRAD|nr:hypothetical protein FXB38_39040 [Bradyrhizobium cytisi]
MMKSVANNGSGERRRKGRPQYRSGLPWLEKLQPHHASITDADATLYCFTAHGLIESRHALLVDACLTLANGRAEQVVTLQMRSVVPTGQQRPRLAPTKPTMQKTSSTSCAR